MKQGYQQMLKNLERKSYSACLTIDVICFFIISIFLLVVAVVCGILLQNDQNILSTFTVSFASGLFGFFGTLIWYLRKAREYMRTQSIELDLKYPGFYDYYQQWQAKIDEITSSTN